MKGQKRAKVEFSLDSLTNNPVLRKQLEGFIEELMLCKSAIKTQKESIKDIVTEARDSIGIPGKILNGLVNEKMNPGSIDEKQHEIEEISDIADGLGMKE